MSQRDDVFDVIKSVPSEGVTLNEIVTFTGLTVAQARAAIQQCVNAGWIQTVGRKKVKIEIERDVVLYGPIE